jgi:hypothetical protein
MLQLAIDRQASQLQYRDMSTNWIPRLARTLARLHSPVLDGYYGEDDADARRMRTELDAIRIRFPDHA